MFLCLCVYMFILYSRWSWGIAFFTLFLLYFAIFRLILFAAFHFAFDSINVQSLFNYVISFFFQDRLNCRTWEEKLHPRSPDWLSSPLTVFLGRRERARFLWRWVFLRDQLYVRVRDHKPPPASPSSRRSAHSQRTMTLRDLHLWPPPPLDQSRCSLLRGARVSWRFVPSRQHGEYNHSKE